MSVFLESNIEILCKLAMSVLKNTHDIITFDFIVGQMLEDYPEAFENEDKSRETVESFNIEDSCNIIHAIVKLKSY